MAPRENSSINGFDSNHRNAESYSEFIARNGDSRGPGYYNQGSGRVRLLRVVSRAILRGSVNVVRAKLRRFASPCGRYPKYRNELVCRGERNISACRLEGSARNRAPDR